jgi:hypothetical protein
VFGDLLRLVVARSYPMSLVSFGIRGKGEPLRLLVLQQSVTEEMDGSDRVS